LFGSASFLTECPVMAKPLLPDALWERIAPLLPRPKPRRRDHPGRQPLTYRQALTGILFVLKTGLRWNDLPAEMRCGSGSRCRRYLIAWHRAGVWQRLHELLLAELNGADKLDWSKASVDSSSVRARGGGEKTGKNPTDRAKPGSKRHGLVDGGGIPLAAIVTAANVADVTELVPVVDAVPPVRGKPGRPRRRPKELLGDRGYDSDPHRAALRRRGIHPVLARRRTDHGSGLGIYRWVVERFHAWLNHFGRLRVRTDWHAEPYEAFLTIACAIICLGFL
jgi:transposase